jgi:hypothetical protein
MEITPSATIRRSPLSSGKQTGSPDSGEPVGGHVTAIGEGCFRGFVPLFAVPYILSAKTMSRICRIIVCGGGSSNRRLWTNPSGSFADCEASLLEQIAAAHGLPPDHVRASRIVVQ